MRTRFYSTSTKASRTTQGIAQKVSRPKLTKDVHAAINARRRLASQSYQRTLKDTWLKIDELTKNRAVAHHKSIRHVQLELHMGRQVGRTEPKKTSAWNAFCWKKAQEKENGRNFWDTIFLVSLFISVRPHSPWKGSAPRPRPQQPG
jgi:hypothetical protein